MSTTEEIRQIVAENAELLGITTEEAARRLKTYLFPNLVSIREIADRLNVREDTVHKWRFRGLLPDPDYPLAVGPVWEWSTIEEWARDTGRLVTEETPK